VLCDGMIMGVFGCVYSPGLANKISLVSASQASAMQGAIVWFACIN
jgi:hypothetical protein